MTSAVEMKAGGRVRVDFPWQRWLLFLCCYSCLVIKLLVLYGCCCLIAECCSMDSGRMDVIKGGCADGWMYDFALEVCAA